MVKGALEVHLRGATGIKNTDFLSTEKCDPYAILTCWRQSFQSTTAKRQGSNPIWNQKFLFVVEDGVSELFIKLYDEDRFTGDDFIGSAKVPLNRVLSELDHPLASYNVIRPSGKVKGEVMVALKFTPKQEEDEGSSTF
ncbi:elicitor-responsive protein 3 isoform X2 [Selaginella moellendorffii]|uniref:elicitor-responsive protein 3 isoform X2 n=1 Tax=Selaginella moellendorffii TaxID=88036 RepID=UPI000D1D080D|nr:elicitor-responsive protein 3 isoform X2 [Selaginella moellendorffii]|eukprot:XP_024533450.1 elicitor-responsive protein 3 isoform X2 [Selaginella moellendorffii]